MKCAGCGSEIPNDASFCPKCGSKAIESASPPAKFSESSPKDLFKRGETADDAEQELWAGGYSGKAMVGSWLAGLVLTVALIVACFLLPEWNLVCIAVAVVIWVCLLITFAYRRLNFHYELTTQRLIHKTGILTRRSDRIEAIDIDDVTFEQGLVERMFGVGKIKISSSDRTHPEIILIGIDDVKRVADLIDEARRKERRKRGIHIESV